MIRTPHILIESTRSSLDMENIRFKGFLLPKFYFLYNLLPPYFGENAYYLKKFLRKKAKISSGSNSSSKVKKE